MRQFKVAVTVPVEEADALRQAIGEARGGIVGEYAFCSFSVTGTGRFRPGVDAHPAIGQVGKMEQVEEERIEVNCAEVDLAALIAVIRDVHSYEEPAIDIYELFDVTSL